MRELLNEEMNIVAGGTDITGTVSSPGGDTTTILCSRGFLDAQLSLLTGGGGSSSGSSNIVIAVPENFEEVTTTLLDEMSGGAVSSGQEMADLINDMTGADENSPFAFREAIVDFFLPTLDDELRDAYIEGPN